MSDGPTDDRPVDDELGRFLRDEVPGPGPGYWEEIDRRLAAAADGAPPTVEISGDGRDTDAEVIRLTDMTMRPESRFSNAGPLLAAAAAVLIVVAGAGFLLTRGGDDGLTEVATDDGATTDDGSTDDGATTDDGAAIGDADDGGESGEGTAVAPPAIRWCYQGGELGQGVTAYADLSAPLAEEPTVRISARTVLGDETFYEVVEGTAFPDGGTVDGEFVDLATGARFPAMFVSVTEDSLTLADDVFVEPAECAALADDIADIDANLATLADEISDGTDVEALPADTPLVWDIDADGEVFGRSEPGLGAEIVRTYQRTDTNLFGTGQRATADDITWIEIDGTPDAASGSTWWVREDVLVATGPHDGPPVDGEVTALPDRDAGVRYTTAAIDGRDQPGFVNETTSSFPAESYLIATGARAIIDEMEWTEVERADGAGVAWVLTPELFRPETIDGGESFTFTSPTGNIACVMSDFAGFGVSCWIGDKDWEIEQPTDDPFCAESDWGNAVDVAADGTSFPCYTDLAWDLQADALPYGLVVELGPYRCQSAEGGVACQNDSGQGFVVNRSEVIRFGS